LALGWCAADVPPGGGLLSGVVHDRSLHEVFPVLAVR
jgi:hypothetical protein